MSENRLFVEWLYQRLFPPRGALLEEAKPPSDDLVSPIS